MKDTDDLKQELMETADLDQFLFDNQKSFHNTNVSDLLNQLFQKKKISKASLAKRSGMSEVYLHQLFSGRRNPSRNRLICLCFGLKASLEETNLILKESGFAQLYPRARRDAIIMYGLTHHMNLFKVNDKLYDEGEETLY